MGFGSRDGVLVAVGEQKVVEARLAVLRKEQKWKAKGGKGSPKGK